MRVIIAGGREFNDLDFFAKAMSSIDVKYTEIVSGCAKGADTLGENYAKAFDIAIKKFPADWNKHGRAAGPLRNIEMADYADMLIAFWDGKSRGTKHMIDTATKKGLIVKVFEYEQ